MMNPRRLLMTAKALILAAMAIQAGAEDIDLYSRPLQAKSNPNVLIILDNAANASNSAVTCNFDRQPGDGLGGTSPMGATVFANLQCAVYNSINALPVNTVNVGIMVFNGAGLDVQMGLPSGTCPGGNGGCLIQPIIPMTAANKTALLSFVQSWNLTGTSRNIKVSSEATASTMQEAWAYFSGQVGISGRNYSSVAPPAGCQNNYLAFIGNAYDTAGSPGDPASPSVSTALNSAYALALSAWTAAGGAATGTPQPAYAGAINIPSGTYGAPPANNSCGAYTMGNHTDPSGLYADEWARFMFQTNLYYQPLGKHQITTYTIGVIGPGNCKPNYPALLTSMAIHGGGKYFANSDARGIYQSLLRVLNEVQAVNSVFSASSLPVSVNTQGTYLNQIYIGMFRPDQFSGPRWYGNLKQYQFGYNPTTRNLFLADAAGYPAISGAGTGFLDPSIASFWSCANSNQLSTAALQIAQAYGQWSQGGPGMIPLCINDPLVGFWANNPNGIGGTFDMPDGDVVEKGGHAQQLRLSYLNENYTNPPGSATNPRNLYTVCPGGACSGPVALANYPFDTSNLAITDVMLGVQSAPILSITSAATVQGSGANAGPRAGAAAVTVSIVGLSKTSSTVTATVSPAADVAAKLYVGAQLNIATGATKYDCTACVVVSVNFAAGTFTYSNPGGGGTPTLPSVATVADNTFWIWSPGNTAQLGQTLTISGCTTFTSLNGTTARVVINPAYNMLPTSGYIDLSVSVPLLPAAANDMGCSYTPNLATVTTTVAHGFTTGATIGINGATPAGYNGVWPITVTSATQFTYQYTVPAPLAAFAGTGAMATAGTTTRDLLMRWVRGEDNYGDEMSLCPPGTAAGVNNCPNPAVNIRPSVHGDVLHSRPVVLNYGGLIVTVTSTADVAGQRHAYASANDLTNLSNLGSSVPVTFSTGQTCSVTPQVGLGYFSYSASNCGVSGAQTVSAGASNIVVFYGGNDGVFRAIDGNQPTYTYTDPLTLAKTTIADPYAGKELWGFIPPEFFPKLKRLHDDTLQVLMASTTAGILPTPQRKDYFADGATGFYQAIDGNGKTIRAILYITMRRGGRFVYAIDVTDPRNPIFLWKHSSADAGFSELGQTWSLPKVVKVKGWANPVMMFGAGYSPSQDSEPPAADTMGRGIFVVDAFTGNLVWSACPAGCSLSVPGMAYAIPADLTLLDRVYNDGLIDRIYATDVGGNVWRVDLEPPKTNALGIACSATSPAGCTPDIWQVNKLAALGCNTGVCAAGVTPRKFLYPVEVIPTRNIDYVFAASGDREHPLYTDPTSTLSNPLPYNFKYALQSPPYAVSAYAVTNRAYLLKDQKTGVDGSGQATLTEGNLYDCTNCSTTSPYPGTGSGYYVTMQTGEKAVNAPLIVAGFVYFGTNQAQPPRQNQCDDTLGEATGYRLSPFSGALAAGEFENGGLPPSPVAGIVNVVDPTTGKTYQVPFCLGCGAPEDNNNNNNQGANCQGESALAGCRPTINVKSSRSRPYWYRTNK